MPEIAEVETVKNYLKEHILNKKITNVQILYPNMVIGDKEEFKSILMNKEFSDVKRRGKWLLFELKDYFLLSHLRMEGKFFLKNNTDKIEKHEHILITFSDNSELRYHDTRKFGKMKLINKDNLEETEEIKKQGKEPLDETLSVEYLKEKFKNKKLPIKSTLLDQTIISGLGNIYADEVLFLAGINPLRKACSLTDYEIDNIIKSSQKVVKKAMEEGGTTIRSYTSSLGIIGNYQKYLKVHTKAGEKCMCGEIIKKIKVGGRGTYYCDKCQK